MSPAKKPEAPHRDRSGWYKLPDGMKCLSVTNIKKHGVPLDLTGWAGWEAGLLAVESLPKLIRARGASERRKLAYWLGQASERKKKEAGALGSAVHEMIECRLLGQPAADPTPQQQPFMDAFDRFMEIEEPVIEATELVLANPDDGWAGTADVYFYLPNIEQLKLPDLSGPALILGDWKSSSKVHADFALQLAAYRRATVGWLKDGTQIVPPKTENAVVIHIRPDVYEDTGYRVWPLDTSDAVYECFLNARRTAVDWVKGLEKTALGLPYDPFGGPPGPPAVVVGETEPEEAA